MTHHHPKLTRVRLLTAPPARPAPVIVFLDPAKRRCGVAVAVDGHVVGAGTVTGSSTRVLAGRVHGFALGVASAVRPVDERSLRWVAELPEVYEDARANEPNLRGLLALVDALPVTEGCFPRTWKANIPKDVSRRRVQALLDASEVGAMSDTTEDTYDAVGGLLWYLGRAGRGMVPVRGRTP